MKAKQIQRLLFPNNGSVTLLMKLFVSGEVVRIVSTCHPLASMTKVRSRPNTLPLESRATGSCACSSPESIQVSYCNFAMAWLAGWGYMESVASSLTGFGGLFDRWLAKEAEEVPEELAVRVRKAFAQGDMIEVVKNLWDRGLSPAEMLEHLDTTMKLIDTVTSLHNMIGSQKKEHSKYLMKITAKLGWDDYLAEPYLKGQLQSIAESLSAKHEQQLNQMQCSTRESPDLNWDPVKVILLWSPPGCGKTYAAQVLAGTSGHTFYELDASAIRGELLGQSEKNLQEVFKSVDGLKGKSIVFFDEADSLLQRRSSSNQYDIQLVDLFLAWTDGIRRKQLSVSSVWEVLSGNCTVSHDCVMSPNFPANYDNYQHCTFQMLSPGPLTVEHFDTEGGHDILTLNGHQFSGGLESRDFEDIIPSGNIEWASDKSNTLSGWKLCGHSKHAKDTSLVLLLATNNKEMMDPAVTSRAVPIHIPLPSSSVRKQWWKKNAKQLGGHEWEALASATSGASFRDLSQMAETAEERAMSSGDSVPGLNVYLKDLMHSKEQSKYLMEMPAKLGWDEYLAEPHLKRQLQSIAESLSKA